MKIVISYLRTEAYNHWFLFGRLQFDTVNDIPKDYFSNFKTIYGRVIRIIDGDTIRVRHCTSRFFGTRRFDPNAKRIYDSTLSIRIYGVDCPELQKRKSDPMSQPFAQEATDFTSKLAMGKLVRIKLLRKDQYGRAIAKVETGRKVMTIPPLSRKDLSIELMKRGLATLYTGGGAEYDGNRDLLESIQAKAQRKKRGVWSLGDNMISPADFKRRQKQTSSEVFPVATHVK